MILITIAYVLMIASGCTSSPKESVFSSRGIATEASPTINGPISATSLDLDGDLIPFSSGKIDPKNYLSSETDRKKFLDSAFEKAKEKDFKSKDDCPLEESSYELLCLIAGAERALNGLPVNHHLKRLFPEEYTSLKWYTDFGSDLYNSALKYQKIEELDRYELEIKLAISGLNRISPFTGDVVRCDFRDEGEKIAKDSDVLKVANRYHVNETRVFKEFLSTSLGQETDYIVQWIVPCRVRLNIHLKNLGVDIAALSDRPWEQEILLPPLSKFKVLSKNQRTVSGRTVFFIELEQL
jgi:hypothetical protein